MTSIHKHNIEEYKTVYKTDLSAKSYEVRNKVELLIKYIPKIKKKEIVLEIGYGTGDLLHYLANKYKFVHFIGLEIVVSALSLYKERFPNDSNVKVVLGNANKKLSFKCGNFDIVICSHVLEHLKDENFFIKSAMQVLKPGGYLVIAVPEWGDSPLHYRQYNKRELERIGKKEKLKIVEIKGDQFYINKLFYK